MLMKKLLPILIGAMLSLTGCDFFRVVAGRPTGEEIENKKQELLLAQKAQEAEQARRDSIAKVEQARAKMERDSVAALEYIAANKVVVHNISRLGGLSRDEVPAGEGRRYKVVVGSYRELANAKAMAYKVGEAGDFCTHLVFLRNGIIVAAACPTDDLAHAVAGLKELKRHEICPPDAWILKME